MVWYRIGSMDEVDGASGVAHVLEHMMFKGTPSVGPGEFNKRVAAAGGRDNAFTSRDYTAYFQQIPKEKLADMMQLEADRMRHLNVDAQEFAQEIKVVMEERRMRTDDNPQASCSADECRRLPGPPLPPPDHRLDERSRKHERRRRQGLVRHLVRAQQRLCRDHRRR
jgi:hypothetical protein